MSATVCGTCGCGNPCCTEGRVCGLPQAGPVKPVLVFGGATATLIITDEDYLGDNAGEYVTDLDAFSLDQEVDLECESLTAGATLINDSAYNEGDGTYTTRHAAASSDYTSDEGSGQWVFSAQIAAGFTPDGVFPPSSGPYAIAVGNVLVQVDWAPGEAPCVTVAIVAFKVEFTIEGYRIEQTVSVTPTIELEHDGECPTAVRVRATIGLEPPIDDIWSFASLAVDLTFSQTEVEDCEAGELDDTCLGRCCFADFSCQDLTETDCDTEEGFWGGPGTACDNGPCAPQGSPPSCCTTVTGACAYNVSLAEAVGAALFTVTRYMCCNISGTMTRTQCPPVAVWYEWDDSASVGCVSVLTGSPPTDFGEIDDCCPGDTGSVSLGAPAFTAEFLCVPVGAEYLPAVDVSISTPSGTGMGFRIYTSEPWISIDVVIQDDQQSLECPNGVFGPEYVTRVQADVVVNGRGACP